MIQWLYRLAIIAFSYLPLSYLDAAEVHTIQALSEQNKGEQNRGEQALSGREIMPELVIWGAANFLAIEPLLLGFQRKLSYPNITYIEFSSRELYEEFLQLADDSKGGNTADISPYKTPDIVMSPAMDLQFKLVNDGYAQAYSSPITQSMPVRSQWHNEIYGFTFEPMVIVINKDILGADLMPQSREQLLDLVRSKSPLVLSKVGLSDIETVGLGYLTWFHDSQQSRTYGRLLEAFGNHHVRLYPNSSAMLRALLKGDIFIAYNVLGSYAMEWEKQHPWIEAIMPTDYTSVIMRTAFIPKLALNPTLAQDFIDYLLSDGQQTLAQQSSLIPLLETAIGENSLENLKRRTHGIFRPIPLGLSLLVPSDQAKRELLLKEWRNTIRQPTH